MQTFLGTTFSPNGIVPPESQQESLDMQTKGRPPDVYAAVSDG